MILSDQTSAAAKTFCKRNLDMMTRSPRSGATVVRSPRFLQTNVVLDYLRVLGENQARKLERPSKCENVYNLNYVFECVCACELQYVRNINS